MICKKCVMPSTRPDHVFVDGICPACINAEKKPDIQWDERKEALMQVLDRHDGRCIVPSSGGKDSHYQVQTLLDLGADPLIVTASTCHLTDVGRKNIDNLSGYATTIEITPNRWVRAILNNKAIELVGDISWPEHVSIFTTPFRVAKQTGINLIMYGENPQHQYGGPSGSENAKQMTARWRSEYGGFLGLRPPDFVGLHGITAKDMRDYELPDIEGVEAHFLGQYIPWDSHRNAEIAKEMGMTQMLPCHANWWEFENLDNAQTGIHDYFMYLKYGYGRAATQLAVDVRSGLINRDFALQICRERDGEFPSVYMGIDIHEIIGPIGLSWEKFHGLIKAYTNYSIFQAHGHNSPFGRLERVG